MSVQIATKQEGSPLRSRETVEAVQKRYSVASKDIAYQFLPDTGCLDKLPSEEDPQEHVKHQWQAQMAITQEATHIPPGAFYKDGQYAYFDQGLQKLVTGELKLEDTMFTLEKIAEKSKDGGVQKIAQNHLAYLQTQTEVHVGDKTYSYSEWKNKMDQHNQEVDGKPYTMQLVGEQSAAPSPEFPEDKQLEHIMEAFYGICVSEEDRDVVNKIILDYQGGLLKKDDFIKKIEPYKIKPESPAEVLQFKAEQLKAGRDILRMLAPNVLQKYEEAGVTLTADKYHELIAELMGDAENKKNMLERLKAKGKETDWLKLLMMLCITADVPLKAAVDAAEGAGK